MEPPRGLYSLLCLNFDGDPGNPRLGDPGWVWSDPLLLNILLLERGLVTPGLAFDFCCIGVNKGDIPLKHGDKGEFLPVLELVR